MKNILTSLFLLLISFTSQAQIGWVGNMFPLSGTVQAGSPFNVFIQTFKSGVTNPPGQGAGINCQIWYGKVNFFGDTWTVQSPIDMSYNVDIGDNDEYLGVMNLTAGLYEYTCRCSDNNGSSWEWRTGPNGRLTVNAVPLAVDWTNVIGERKKDEVVITWSTSMETNNDYFEIESADDKQNFVSVGKVDAKNLIAQKGWYSFKVKDHLENTYYRVKSVDFNGVEDFSKTIFVPIRDDENLLQLKIYPNPVQDFLFVEGLELDKKVNITDFYGRNVMSLYYKDKGMDISQLASGKYFLHVGIEKILFVKM